MCVAGVKCPPYCVQADKITVSAETLPAVARLPHRSSSVITPLCPSRTAWCSEVFPCTAGTACRPLSALPQSSTAQQAWMPATRQTAI
jgi:hypothetical protein